MSPLRNACEATSPLHGNRKTPKVTEGTVKFFNTTKGFGFIQPDTGGADVFVHISAVERAGMRTIVEGQKLSFDVVQDRRSGKSAADNLQAA
jgi:CspA family cold shock protein